MKRVIEESKVTKRFTDHDIRAKVGSDAENLERAKEILAHADTKTAQRSYRHFSDYK